MCKTYFNTSNKVRLRNWNTFNYKLIVSNYKGILISIESKTIINVIVIRIKWGKS